MTIGIAAFGPRAGLAVWSALRAVETVGRGAIGGFASFVVIGADGLLHRAEIQRGGAAALFGQAEVPPVFSEARHAAVMSSGPDRPAPLSQFTPADPAVGLVTGHRLPNTLGVDGRSLNADVLHRMRQGRSPQEAVDQVVGANPRSDAGIIALALDGRIHAADTALLAQFGDAGAATLRGEAGAVASVLHNAIRPHRGLALVAAGVALEVMTPSDHADGAVTFAAGVPLRVGPRNLLVCDAAARIVAIEVADPRYADGRWSLGLGYRVAVTLADGRSGNAVYEPYLVVEDGIVLSADGSAGLTIPIRFSAGTR